MNNQNVGCVVEEERVILEQATLLEEKVKGFEAAITSLENRLDMVMTPEPIIAQPVDGEKMPDVSQFACRLISINSGLAAKISWINRLVNRLEI
jgi:hypothetical protein